MKRQACAWLLIAFAARGQRRDRAHCGRPAHVNLLPAIKSYVGRQAENE
jgi:hypothetical protein